MVRHSPEREVLGESFEGRERQGPPVPRLVHNLFQPLEFRLWALGIWCLGVRVQGLEFRILGTTTSTGSESRP